ncbi:putative membrane protein [Amycolatopsis endophytica]|uniref:Putative membrane protein n=1 Tax=Amycolatopsis endophytica TaxID=860233 RepID=A0A853BDG4_9PSEU|nr:YibE/F family protein [Amycolatopsis endophytica]NYI92476.1 putative membrane protein [Amycolatopsis endophytica]
MRHDDDNAEADTGPIPRVPGPPPAAPSDRGQRRARRTRGYAGPGGSPDRPSAADARQVGTGRHGRRQSTGEHPPARRADPAGVRRAAAEPAEATGHRAAEVPTRAAGTGAGGASRRTHSAKPVAPGTPDRPGGAARRRRSTTPAEPDRETGHGHGHGPAAPASRRVKLLLAWILGPLALITVAAALVLYPWGQDEPTSAISSGTPVHGTITTATSGPCLAAGQVQVGVQPDPDAKPCLTVQVTLEDGPAGGRGIELTVPVEPSTPRFSAGDDVVLAYNGGDAADPASYQLIDFQRGLPLVVLAALFAVAVVVLGRWHGLAALGALVLSFVVLVAFVLPAILAGQNPLLVAIIAAGLIMFIALYLTHGLSARTSVAVLGTLVSLALIGALSALFSAAASLTGLDDSTSTLIASLGHGIDARGLLLAGIVIGALGVLDDVTVTQTSAVWELRRANPALTWRELYSAGLRIGRDHVGSAVNTLVMAYAGAALPVMLYSSISGVGLGSILGSQDVAQEIVRTLAGSVGIVAAVPVTTVLAALIASREPISHISPTSDH